MSTSEEAELQSDDTTSKCRYVTPENDKCLRPTWEGVSNHDCVFHCKSSKPIFIEKLREEINKNNGDWKGFYFPKDLDFREVLGDNSRTEINFPVDARWSNFNYAKIEQITFKEACDFSEIKFTGDTQFKNCIFEGSTKFESCIFENKTEFLNVVFKGAASFAKSEFYERTVLRVCFTETANLNDSIFKDTVRFEGWDNITIHLSESVSVFDSVGNSSTSNSNLSIKERAKQFLQSQSYSIKNKLSAKRYGVEEMSVFQKEGLLENVIFYKPDQIVFNRVNMSHVYVKGTNFRGSRFLAVNWYQSKLGRDGLYDELIIRDSADPHFRQKNFSILEDSYRNIRAALEENLRYSAAADFYVGEMEARRSQLNLLERYFFSIPAWYQAVSNYGTNVLRAFKFLIYFLALYWAISIWINFNYEIHDCQFVWRILQRGLGVLSFQKFEDSAGAGVIVNMYAQKWADIGLKFVGISQLTMIVFAFRSRIKRH